jgi:hypothetical protein
VELVQASMVGASMAAGKLLAVAFRPPPSLLVGGAA